MTHCFSNIVESQQTLSNRWFDFLHVGWRRCLKCQRRLLFRTVRWIEAWSDVQESRRQMKRFHEIQVRNWTIDRSFIMIGDRGTSIESLWPWTIRKDTLYRQYSIWKHVKPEENRRQCQSHKHIWRLNASSQWTDELCRHWRHVPSQCDQQPYSMKRFETPDDKAKTLKFG
jgi:hypothetical protein